MPALCLSTGGSSPTNSIHPVIRRLARSVQPQGMRQQAETDARGGRPSSPARHATSSHGRVCRAATRPSRSLSSALRKSVQAGTGGVFRPRSGARFPGAAEVECSGRLAWRTALPPPAFWGRRRWMPLCPLCIALRASRNPLVRSIAPCPTFSSRVGGQSIPMYL